MRHDAKSLCCDESFVSWENQEKDMSTSLTVRWSWKHKRWESDNAFFWNDRKTKWSCRSEGGKYYYAIHAWESGWGYVWGTYGCVLTDSLFAYKLEQYPDGVGNYEDFIRENWLGGRTTDCVGLIKGYGWLNPDTMAIDYGTNGMPDLGANQMYYSASVSGTIDTMPDIPGLAVWHDGHIGVYIGNGEVIEAMGTKYGVVKTELAVRSWTHWLQIEYINYD